MCIYGQSWGLHGAMAIENEDQPATSVDICGVQCNEIGVSVLDFVHTVLHTFTADAVQVWFEVLGGKCHDHALAFHHLIVGDDAPACLLQWTLVECSQPLMHLRTCVTNTPVRPLMNTS